MNRVLARRWRWLALGALVVVAGAVAVTTAWPYLKYPDTEHRLAAQYLDSVTVGKGYAYVGEDVDDYSSVSRYWIKRGSDVQTIPTYDHAPLRTDGTNGGSLPTNRYQQEIGWAALPGDDPPCTLSAFRVLSVDPGLGIDLSSVDRQAVADKTSTLIGVTVTCGLG